MQADEEVLQLLADKVEGNLLAANQEVQKLRILSPGDKLDAAMVLEAVSDSSRFNGFALTEACLSGNTERALKVLQHLEAERKRLSRQIGVKTEEMAARLAAANSRLQEQLAPVGVKE